MLLYHDTPWGYLHYIPLRGICQERIEILCDFGVLFQIWVYRIVCIAPFCPWRQKGAQRAPLKESTHGTFLKNPFPLSARHFAYGEMANALSSRSLPWSRVAVRVTAARLAPQLGGKVDCFSKGFALVSCPQARERRLPSPRQGVTRSPYRAAKTMVLHEG